MNEQQKQKLKEKYLAFKSAYFDLLHFAEGINNEIGENFYLVDGDDLFNTDYWFKDNGIELNID